uniref:Putative conserved plasma membrane protein n=1 Tax=Ixodes ricinus TaxID=34613 RepID=A0A090XF99_IXORI
MVGEPAVPYPMLCKVVILWAGVVWSVLVAWFPQLEEVVLHVQDGMNIRELSKLKRLRSLERRNSPTIPFVVYRRRASPSSLFSGRRLLRLGLEHFDVIDLGRTNAMCPELEALSLRWFILLGCSLPVTHSRTVAVKPFQNLRELTLRPRVGRLVHRDACELLLSHCQNIRHIELFLWRRPQRFLSVTAVQEKMVFPKLRSLRLRHDHALSADGLQSFLSKSFQPKILERWEVYSEVLLWVTTMKMKLQTSMM